MTPKPAPETAQSNGSVLAVAAQRARERYMDRITGSGQGDWWSAVLVTASSARQADCYREEMERRRVHGKLPEGVVYLAVPDVHDERIGSGGATLNALHTLAHQACAPDSAASWRQWWASRRVLIIHSGGDSRRLPQYSLSGKLFSALPVCTPWGEVSTIFDEMLALSTLWVEQIDSGLLVCSGDVILNFDARRVNWNRPGVTGVAIRQPFEVGQHHGIYVVDEQDRVRSFLQKPSVAQIKAAGGLIEGERVAVDTGLLRFDPAVSARLTVLATAGDQPALGPAILSPHGGRRPTLDLYEHFTLTLTRELPGECCPAAAAVQRALSDTAFWCGVVDGDFTHVGTTRLFRSLMTGDSSFSQLYETRQRLGITPTPGFSSAGVMIDCAFTAGGVLGPGALAIECALDVPVSAGAGAILHGLTGLTDRVEVPPDLVVHQVPITAPIEGYRGAVVRVYSVEDDPKRLATDPAATWLGRPILESLEALGLDPDVVWAGVPVSARGLWNADLFPLGGLEEVWQCARWMMGYTAGFSAGRWAGMKRLSLARSTEWADRQALAEARTRRLQSNWRAIALSLAESDSDICPMLAHAPGVMPLAAVGRELARRAAGMEDASLTKAASRYIQAGLFLRQAGLAHEAELQRDAAFACVRKAVEAGTNRLSFEGFDRTWEYQAVTVGAPARIDFGGGWSDTPPFCLDWGGTVLNMAIQLNGRYPIRTAIRRIPETVVRCFCDEDASLEFGSAMEILAAAKPGGRFAIPAAALQIFGLTASGQAFPSVLRRAGGGLEIRTAVDLPMGSGLGTSSILAATVLRALSAISGVSLSDSELSDCVMHLEQLLTTGGGWQDQAGGIFPGTKLISSGPGLRQRLRVQPVQWNPERRSEFEKRFTIYYTGMQRLAKNLLTEVVSRYLAHEPAAVEVLHSIKTLAGEMAYAMQDGEWEYLGDLLDRHWKLNQILDPHTTNLPISALLQDLRPYLAGAKLAGAGGGGFLMLVTATPENTARLRKRLESQGGTGALYEFEIANEGLHVETAEFPGQR